MRRLFFIVLASCFLAVANAQSIDADEYAVVKSNRVDGRFVSTYGIVHEMLKDFHPKYAYHAGMTAAEFAQWQDNVRDAMKEIMCFPEIEGQPAPVCVKKEQREGYTVEKWEFYPLPKAVSTFLVLKPDGLSSAVPAVLCIPGSGQTKEEIAGEASRWDSTGSSRNNPKRSMALDMVRAGYVAVAVDNAAAGEASDLEEKFDEWHSYDYDVVSRYLLEMGWHWLGYTSFLDMQVLGWMKQQDFIRKDRIVVSGFSLGTEPMMVLGVMDKSIYAFVYNDFLCQTQERAIVMTKPDSDGRRDFPNSIRHLIPNYWRYFNFPDVAASLAPRPIIFTEGGLDRDFSLVRSAYEDSGSPDNAEFHHYPKFADAANRKDVQLLPEGMDRTTYFPSVNVDTRSHYFKHELVMPWLKSVLK